MLAQLKKLVSRPTNQSSPMQHVKIELFQWYCRKVKARRNNSFSMSFSKRCFISHLYTGSIVANSRESLVRIMATVLHIEPVRTQSQDRISFPGAQDQRGELLLLKLDDGTAVVDLWTPHSMIQKLSLRPGMLVECIARLCQNGKVRRFYAETIILVTNPDIEHLRWMELGNPPKSKNDSRRYGYPTVESNADEAYRLICLQSRMEHGVRMEDLAMVMRKTETEMKSMIQELQMNGQVYQNGEGKYVPL